MSQCEAAPWRAKAVNDVLRSLWREQLCQILFSSAGVFSVFEVAVLDEENNYNYLVPRAFPRPSLLRQKKKTKKNWLWDLFISVYFAAKSTRIRPALLICFVRLALADYVPGHCHEINNKITFVMEINGGIQSFVGVRISVLGVPTWGTCIRLGIWYGGTQNTGIPKSLWRCPFTNEKPWERGCENRGDVGQ